jgi:hypothetical protein
MPNYAEGKIYAIKSPETDKVYIGSTTQSLNKRFIGHKHDAVKDSSCKSKEIFQYKNPYIELIENYSCKTIEELHAKEVEIMKRTPNIINKVMPGIRTVNPLKKEKNTEAKRKARQRQKDARLSGVPIPVRSGKIGRPVKIYTHIHTDTNIEVNALKQEILKLRNEKDAEIKVLKQEILKLRNEKGAEIKVLKQKVIKMQNEIIQILTHRNKLMKQVSAMILENKILKLKLDKYIKK